MYKGKISENRNKEKYLEIIFCIIIVGFSLCYLNRLNGIQHSNDEAGYWTAAAFFSGLDWTELSSYNLYYSYGYGIVLAVILNIFPNEYLYQAAIILNTIFLVTQFLVSIHCLKKILKEIDSKTIILLCFVVTVYPYNLFYVHLTVCELLQSMILWICILVFIKICENDKGYFYIVLAGLCGYLYMIHMRNIAAVIAMSVSLLVICICKSVRKIHLLYFFSFLTLMLIVAYCIKNAYNAEYSITGAAALANDYSGQSSKIKYIFSIKGGLQLLLSVVGKWYGICASSLFLISFGLIGLVKKIINEIRILVSRKKSRDRYIGLYIFLLLNFLGNFGISAIFFVSPEKYADYIIYTRYMETAALPVIAYGGYRVCREKVNLYEYGINICILIISSLITIEGAKILGLNSYVGQANVAIWDLYSSGMSTSAYIGKVTIRTIILFVILGILISKKRRFNLGLIGLGILWLNTSMEAYTRDNRSRAVNDVTQITQIIQEYETEQDIYYYVNDWQVSPTVIFYYQLQNPNQVIHVLTESWQLDQVKKGEYVLTNDIYSIPDIEEYKILEKSSNYYFMMKSNE